MKTTIFLFFFVLSISLSAVNLEVNVSQSGPFIYDNESAVLNIFVVNNEVTLASEGTSLVYSLNSRNGTLPLGDIAAGQSVEKKLDFGRLSAGTYSFDYYISSSFLGIEDFTNQMHSSITVLRSSPVVMKSFPVVISAINIPTNPSVNTPITISFDVNTSIDSALLTTNFNFQNQTEELHGAGMHDIRRTYSVSKGGSYTFEVYAFSSTNGEPFLEDSKSITILVSNPEEYEPISPSVVEPEQGNVSVDIGKNPLTDLVSEVGCFATGCKADFQPPVMSKVTIEEMETNFVFSFTTSDVETGNSSIVSCDVLINGVRKQLAASPAYGATQLSLTYSTENKDIGESLEFSCTDDQSNSAYVTYEISRKERGTLSITATDEISGIPVADAVVSLNGKERGSTDDSGRYQVSLFPSEYAVSVKAKGYAPVSFDIQVKEKDSIEKKLVLKQAYERHFEIPGGFENYALASDAGNNGATAIHPQEEKLMSYSFPIYSTSKVDVSKDLMKIVDKYLNYDYSCLEYPIPSTCEAWLKSDYDVIAAHSGVCYDWATLGTSFADSYGIPARYVSGCWESKSLTGKVETSCHAWQEVYLPELGGWKHLDTLWDEFDNPCAYASGMTVTCFSGASAYVPGQTDEDRSSTYVCGKPCSSAVYSPPTSPEKMFAENVTGYNFEYNVSVLDSNRIGVVFGRELLKEENAELEINRNESAIVEYLLSLVSPQFANGSISKIKLLNTNSSKVLIYFEVNYSSELSEFRHQFTISQYSTVRYYFDSGSRYVSLVEPTPVTRNESNFYWFFDKGGSEDIRVFFEEAKPVFLLSGELQATAYSPLVSRSKGKSILYDAAKSNADILTDIGTSNEVIIPALFTEIPSGLDSYLQERGKHVLRFNYELEPALADAVGLFWSNADSVVIADEHDFGAIDLGSKKAVELGVPLLVFSNDISKKDIETIQKLTPRTIYFVGSPEKNYSSQLSVLSNYGTVNKLFYPSSNETIELKKTAEKTVIGSSSTNWALMGIIAVAILALLVFGGLKLLRWV